MLKAKTLIRKDFLSIVIKINMILLMTHQQLNLIIIMIKKTQSLIYR